MDKRYRKETSVNGSRRWSERELVPPKATAREVNSCSGGNGGANKVEEGGSGGARHVEAKSGGPDRNEKRRAQKKAEAATKRGEVGQLDEDTDASGEVDRNCS